MKTWEIYRMIDVAIENKTISNLIGKKFINKETNKTYEIDIIIGKYHNYYGLNDKNGLIAPNFNGFETWEESNRKYIDPVTAMRLRRDGKTIFVEYNDGGNIFIKSYGKNTTTYSEKYIVEGKWFIEEDDFVNRKLTKKQIEDSIKRLCDDDNYIYE